MPFYTPGHSFYAMFAPEVGGITEGTAGAEPATPAVPTAGLTIIGQINPADIMEDDGDEKGFGAGSNISLYDQRKGRVYESSITQRITSLALAQRCIPTVPGTVAAGAPYGLPMSALFYGTAAAADVYRMSVCNSFALSFAEGSGAELSATMQFWSVFKDTAIVIVPTPTDMQMVGSPASWHDMTAFTIGGTDRRKEISSISSTQNNNLERKGFRPNYTVAGIKASRCVWEIMPHLITGEGELQFHSKFNTTINNWGDIVMTIGATVWTYKNCRPQQRHQPGVEASAQLGFSVPFKFDYMTIA